MPAGTERDGQGRARFSGTRWSLVLAAADSRNPDSAAALDELCAAYWYPVYAFVRRCGSQSEDARDLTQGFFAELLEKRTLKAARRERGRFRSFLLAALKFYLSHERERAGALKRGGGNMPIRLDADTAEGRYRLEPAEPQTPETLYERRWALALLERVLDRLHREQEESTNPERARRLMAYLGGDALAPPYKEVAVELGMTEAAVKVAVHRLRGRYRDLLRDEVLQTVDDSGKVDDELRHLYAALERS